jgi:hypothetical protein
MLRNYGGFRRECTGAIRLERQTLYPLRVTGVLGETARASGATNPGTQNDRE